MFSLLSYLLCPVLLLHIPVSVALQLLGEDSWQHLTSEQSARVGLWDLFLDAGRSAVVDVKRLGGTSLIEGAAASRKRDNAGYTLKQLLGPNEEQAGLPVFILTTDDEKGVNRTTHLMRQCTEQGLQCMRLNSVSGFKIQAIDKKDIAAFDLFLNRKDEIALLAQDDTHFVPDLLRNLAATVRELPMGWHALHLCPGMLWGRHYCTRNGIISDFHLHPEAPLLDANITGGGRAFLDWPRGSPEACCTHQLGVVPGAPVSMLMTHVGARETREELRKWLNTSKTGFPDDMVFRDVAMSLPRKHFLAREPQLCAEMACAAAPK
mmetsp:Transcript_6402/g.9897  ORF Transcript_6402/g.9897 Transcript_6402/m.9897 type:complete len:321 (+) Transcript_6402:72-1034(+)